MNLLLRLIFAYWRIENSMRTWLNCRLTIGFFLLDRRLRAQFSQAELNWRNRGSWLHQFSSPTH